MSNFESEDYKLLIALRAVKAMYEMTGNYHLSICGRVYSMYTQIYETGNVPFAKIEAMIAKWPNGNGNAKYPIDITGCDLHEQFKNMLTKKDDWVYYGSYAKKRRELLKYLIKQMEAVCSSTQE